MEGPYIWYSHGCHVSQLQHWVSVGQGQEMELRREAEVPPGGLKGQAKQIRCYSAVVGSILSREQLFKPDSGRLRGGEIRGAETQQEAATTSTERDNVAWTC